MAKKVIYYINQFFGGIGGEEVAGTPLFVKEGAIGPAQGFARGWGGDCLLSHTIVCGDNYFSEHKEDALAAIFSLVEEQKPDLFVAGQRSTRGATGSPAPACAWR